MNLRRWDMSFSINTNIAAQSSLNTINNANQGVNQSTERFATGSRINRAADDASGMALADALGSQARGAGQMMSNAVNDISRFQIADAVLGQATDMIQGIGERVAAASSAALSSEERGMLQQEVTKSLEYLGDMYNSAEFNGQKLFSDAPGLSSLSEIDLSSVESSQASLELVDEALDATSSLRGDFGARQNQAASNISNLGTEMLNAYQSASTVEDVDIRTGIHEYEAYGRSSNDWAICLETGKYSAAKCDGITWAKCVIENVDLTHPTKQDGHYCSLTV